MMSSFRRINDASPLIPEKLQKNDTATAKLSAEKGKVYVICKSNPRFKARQR